jgi:hypothetical protein
VSIVQGVRDKDLLPRKSFDSATEGVVPSLIIEIASDSDPRIWKVDHEEKVDLYERIGIPEYVIIDLPRPGTGFRFRLTGYRLNARRKYKPIQPDAEGRFVCEKVGLAFALSPGGHCVLVFDAASGRRLLTPDEEVEARQAAEIQAAREAEARQAAEAEIVRLRAEIERLKGGG